MKKLLFASIIFVMLCSMAFSFDENNAIYKYTFDEGTFLNEEVNYCIDDTIDNQLCEDWDGDQTPCESYADCQWNEGDETCTAAFTCASQIGNSACSTYYHCKIVTYVQIEDQTSNNYDADFFSSGYVYNIPGKVVNALHMDDGGYTWGFLNRSGLVQGEDYFLSMWFKQNSVSFGTNILSWQNGINLSQDTVIDYKMNFDTFTTFTNSNVWKH